MIFKRKTLTLIVLALLAAFTVGELFARFVLGLGTPPLSMTHPTIEYMFRPRQDVYRFGNHILINEYGMRSPSFAPTKQGDELRVMIFGDSVLNGGNLTDQPALATTILQEQLTRITDRKVIVGNISAHSWGPGNWLAYAREYGFFDADAVVVVISSHDSRDIPTFAPLSSNTHPSKRPISALYEGMTRYLPRYLPALGSSTDLSGDPDASPKTEDQAPEDQSLADLMTFLRLARQAARTVLVVQHLEKSEVESGTAKPGYEEIRAACRAAEVPSVALWEHYRQSLNAGIDPYRDNIHLNEAGQRILSMALFATMQSPR